MDFTDQHIYGYGLFIICCLNIGYVWLFKGAEIYKDIKGENGRWDAPELIIIFCLIIWAPIILADAFFGFHASDKAWDSIGMVVAFALAGKVGLKFVAAYAVKKSPPVNNTDQSVNTTIVNKDYTKPEGE